MFGRRQQGEDNIRAFLVALQLDSSGDKPTLVARVLDNCPLYSDLVAKVSYIGSSLLAAHGELYS